METTYEIRTDSHGDVWVIELATGRREWFPNDQAALAFVKAMNEH